MKSLEFLLSFSNHRLKFFSLKPTSSSFGKFLRISHGWVCYTNSIILVNLKNEVKLLRKAVLINWIARFSVLLVMSRVLVVNVVDAEQLIEILDSIQRSLLDWNSLFFIIFPSNSIFNSISDQSRHRQPTWTSNLLFNSYLLSDYIDVPCFRIATSYKSEKNSRTIFELLIKSFNVYKHQGVYFKLQIRFV